MTTRAIIERLRNDRFVLEGSGVSYRRGWNDCSHHVERVLVGLRELRDAPAMDLRLRVALVEGL